MVQGCSSQSWFLLAQRQGWVRSESAEMSELESSPKPEKRMQLISDLDV